MGERRLVALLKELRSLIGDFVFYKHFTATRFSDRLRRDYSSKPRLGRIAYPGESGNRTSQHRNAVAFDQSPNRAMSSFSHASQ